MELLYGYVWSGGLGSGSPVGSIAPGNYTVTITDNNGCTLVEPISIGHTNTTLSISSVITNSTCQAKDGSITVTTNNGTAPYTYQWNILPNPGNTNAVNALDSGNYTVTITDVNGCQTTTNSYLYPPTVLISRLIQS